MRSSVSALQGFCLGAAASLAAITLNPGQAEAYVVTVRGIQYDVTTYTTTPINSPADFEILSNGGLMPWYGNAQLAQDFATEVKGILGYPNCQIASACGGGPFFAYSRAVTGFTDSYLWYQPTNALRGPQGNLAAQSRTFAKASFIGPAPVPGPLPLLGAGAAFGFSHRLRKRMQNSRQPLASQALRA